METSNESLSAKQNSNLVRQWVEAVNRNDVEGELACWQPDGEFFIVPTNTTYKGLSEIRKAGEKSAAMVGGQPAEGRKQITNLFAGDDWACVEYDSEATITGPVTIQNLTIIPEGTKRTVILKACVVIHLKDHKIYRAREYFDSSSMARQLGLDQATLAKMYSELGAENKESDSNLS